MFESRVDEGGVARGGGAVAAGPVPSVLDRSGERPLAAEWDWSDERPELAPDAQWSEPAPVLPEYVGVTPPGAALCAMLEPVDRAGLPDADLVVLLQARARLVNRLAGQLMADLVAVASRCDPIEFPPGCRDGIYPAVDEISAALAWTGFTAAVQLHLAEQVVRLPALHAAMLSGDIDYAKAKTIAQAVAQLDPDVANRIIDLVLAGAATRTTGQLRHRLGRLVIKADPDAARRRYRDGIKSRRLEHGREDDGTASLYLRNLPADRAAAAVGRIQAIADWIKDGGDVRTLDQIRADTTLDLLTGLPVPGPDGQDHRRLPGDPDPAGSTDAETDNPDPADDPGQPGQTAAPEQTGVGGAVRGGVGPAAGRPAEGAPGPRRAEAAPDPRRQGRRVGPRGACATCGQTKLNRGLELTAPVATLLALSQDPGQLGSWGPLIAEATRNLVGDLINAPWKVSLTDHNGQVIWHGPIRSRPDPAERRRFPTASQAAFVRARDRRCRFPTCRRPAARSEIDHSLPHAHGGPTHVCCLQCLCQRHHVLKTAGLWTAHMLPDGTVLWRSYLGQCLISRPEPVNDPELDAPTEEHRPIHHARLRRALRGRRTVRHIHNRR